MSNNYTLVLFDADHAEIPLPSGLSSYPLWYEWDADGGPSVASVAVLGAAEAAWDLLRYLTLPVEIHNRNGVAVWWGVIESVVTGSGAWRSGLDVKEMANRVRVFRTSSEDLTDTVYRGAWVEDAGSIAQHGIKELSVDLGAISASEATAAADSLLSRYSVPLGVHEFVADERLTAVLGLRGYYGTLDWRYADVDAGLEKYDTRGSASQVLGQGFTDDTIGFTLSGRISDLDGRMEHLVRGHQVKVSGSASNNGTYTIKSVDDRPAQSLTASTISFDPTDDFHDSGLRLSFLNRDDWFTVAGSASNDGTYRCTFASGEHGRTDPASIVLESAGASVTVARGNRILVNEAVAREAPGATVTVQTVGQRVAQSFELAYDTSWTVATIMIRAYKVGGMGDDIKVTLHADSSGAPGPVLDSYTLSGSLVPWEMDWISFLLSNTDIVTYGTKYWIVAERTGTDRADNYFVLGVDEGRGYARGDLLLWDGSAWVTRSPDAVLLFRVLGSVETTTQIEDIITEYGDRLAGVEIVDASGVNGNQWRTGEQTAGEVVGELLARGDSSGNRLLCQVSRERIAKVYAQPDRAEEVKYYIGADGRLREQGGQLAQPGKLPAGEWVDLAMIPPTVGYANRITPVFVQRAVYDCVDEEMAVVPDGVFAGWNLGRRQKF